ncbi:hypothetical protein EF294_19180 [Gordonia oryzae]|uniref:Novel STAND NTPase 1 domain-containing protein n=1 Tax=Gordonia oryzae TaxID=2487349 RepID=A0A3N4G9B5_9ACTN|nr:AAA family ATPase [Gordonia oryzae]RPA57166.1 hypothetical protein EF294_19180 [Gordonia oryzae]
MTTRLSDASVVDGPGRFGSQLHALFTAAGSPTLAATIAGAARLAPGRGEVSVQRLSDWRRGRHLPARFETLEPVLVWLILQAQSRGADTSSLRDWRRWWSAANGTRTRDPGPSKRRTAEPIPTLACPYPGLGVMTAEDREVFFGRDRVLDELAAVIGAADRDRELSPAVVLVTGVSGAGKSSLLRAGLARLAERPENRWKVHARPAVALLDNADGQGAEGTGGDEYPDQPDPDQPDPDQHRVEQSSVEESDQRGTGLDDHAAAPTLTVQVVDQLEQVLVGQSRRAPRVQQLMESLGGLASRPGTVVVVGARADMYEMASTLEPVASAWQHRSIVVPPMTDTELEEVIAAPARVSGIRVDKGLAPTILSDLRGLTGRRGPIEDRAGQLPLVAHVLSVMWATRAGATLTVSGYHEAGGVSSAIAESAEAMWQALTPVHRVTAQRLLLSLIHISDGVTARRPRRFADLVALGDDRAGTVAVIEALSESRLVTVSDQQVQIIHDVVLSAWPRLSELIERTRDSAPVLERVTTDAAEWDRQGRDTSLLYNPTRYEWAAQVAENPVLGSVARDFLATGRHHIDIQRRRRRWAIAAVSLLAVISVVAAGVAIFSNVALARESNNARFSALLSSAGRLAQTDPGLAAQLAVGAWRIHPDNPLARMRVLQTQQLPLPISARAGHQGAVYDLGLTSGGADGTGSGGRLLATASYDRSVRLWRADNPRDIVAAGPALRGYGSFVTSVDFRPGSPTLASADGEGKIAVWDIADLAHPVRTQTLQSPYGTGTSYILRYDRTGRVLATTHDNGVVTLWDTTAPGGYRAVSEIGEHTGPVRTVALSPTRPVLVAGSDDGTISLSDIADPAAPVHLSELRDGIDSGWHSVAISPDGTLLAAGRDDGTVAVWNIADPRSPIALGRVRAHGAAIWSVGFSADGRSLISAGLDGFARRWDVGSDGTSASADLLTELGVPMRTSGGAFFTAREIAPQVVLTAGGAGTIQAWDIPAAPQPAHSLPITQTSVSPDGTTLATSAADQTIALWNLPRGRAPTELSRISEQPRPSGGYVTAFNRTGTILASAFTGGGEVDLYDIADRRAPRRLVTLPVQTRHTFPLAFDPTRDLLVTGSSDNSIQLWDIADPHAPRMLGQPFATTDGFIEDVQFGPDGGDLVVADAAHRITRWDIDDPRNPHLAQQMTSHTSAVNAAVFSHDGRFIYGGADDQTISVTAVGSESSARVRVPTGVRVTSLSVSADGATLVVGADLSVQLWDISTPDAPKPIARDESITAESAYVREPMIAPNDVIYAGGRSDLQWWTIDAGAVASRVCAADNHIDRGTWDEFAEGVQYPDICPG